MPKAIRPDPTASRKHQFVLLLFLPTLSICINVQLNKHTFFAPPTSGRAVQLRKTSFTPDTLRISSSRSTSRVNPDRSLSLVARYHGQQYILVLRLCHVARISIIGFRQSDRAMDLLRLLMRIDWEDLDYLIACPTQDVVHCLLFAPLFIWIQRIGL